MSVKCYAVKHKFSSNIKLPESVGKTMATSDSWTVVMGRLEDIPMQFKVRQLLDNDICPLCNEGMCSVDYFSSGEFMDMSVVKCDVCEFDFQHAWYPVRMSWKLCSL